MLRINLETIDLEKSNPCALLLVRWPICWEFIVSASVIPYQYVLPANKRTK